MSNVLSKITINVNSPEGTSLRLIEVAHQYANKLQLNWTRISKEMLKGDHNHLVEVFNKYFNEYVTLVRK